MWNAEALGGLIQCYPAEILQFDDAALPRVAAWPIRRVTGNPYVAIFGGGASGREGLEPRLQAAACVDQPGRLQPLLQTHHLAPLPDFFRALILFGLIFRVLR